MTHNRISRAAVLAALAVLLAAAGGCTSGAILERARALSDQVGEYRQRQKDRVERINIEYREAFSRNMDELVHLSDTELRQRRDVDAQALADQIIVSDNATLYGSLRSRIADAMRNHRQAVADADKAVADVREAYVKSYGQAKLELSKLDEVQSDLRVLSEQEDQLGLASRVIQALVNNHRELRKEQEKQQAKQPQGGGGGDT